MSTPHDSNMPIDENSIPWLPTALRYGLIGGLVSVIYGLMAIMFDFAIPTSLGTMALQLLVAIGITIAFLVLTIRQHRNNELDGFISLKRAFLVGFVTLVIIGLINNLFNMIYMNFIDPNFAADAIDKIGEFMEGLGVPDDEIDKQLEDTKEKFTTVGMLKQAFLWGPMISAVAALIVGAIMKKTRPLV